MTPFQHVSFFPPSFLSGGTVLPGIFFLVIIVSTEQIVAAEEYILALP